MIIHCIKSPAEQSQRWDCRQLGEFYDPSNLQVTCWSTWFGGQTADWINESRYRGVQLIAIWGDSIIESLWANGHWPRQASALYSPTILTCRTLFTFTKSEKKYLSKRCP